jgi:hypothetical protein
MNWKPGSVGAAALALAATVATAPAAAMVETVPAVTPPRAAQTPGHATAIGAIVSGSSATDLRLDPRLFFEQLVARYRALRSYSDTTSIVQVTRLIDDDAPLRTETYLQCDVRDGRLEVRAAARQVQKAFGLHLDLALRVAEPVEQAALHYDLWHLPHMALKFSDNPLQEFRAGVPEGFIATDAAAITMDVGGIERSMVHIELKSGTSGARGADGPPAGANGAGLSGSYTARYDIYVDPESMLIERIEGEQRLPDGVNMHTSYQIRPTIGEESEGHGLSSARDGVSNDAGRCAPAAAPAVLDDLPRESFDDEPQEAATEGAVPTTPTAGGSKCLGQ